MLLTCCYVLLCVAMCSDLQVRERLTQRKDDTEERVRLRLDQYREVCVANVLLTCC